MVHGPSAGRSGGTSVCQCWVCRMYCTMCTCVSAPLELCLMRWAMTSHTLKLCSFGGPHDQLQALMLLSCFTGSRHLVYIISHLSPLIPPLPASLSHLLSPSPLLHSSPLKTSPCLKNGFVVQPRSPLLRPIPPSLYRQSRSLPTLWRRGRGRGTTHPRSRGEE